MEVKFINVCVRSCRQQVEVPTKPTFKKLVRFVEEHHLGLHVTAEEETPSEEKAAETDSVPADVEALLQSPIDTEVIDAPERGSVQEEPENVDGFLQTEIPVDEVVGGDHDEL